MSAEEFNKNQKIFFENILQSEKKKIDTLGPYINHEDERKIWLKFA